MESFDTILVEGIFYHDPDGKLLVKSLTGPVIPLDETLARVQDREVQLAMHHLPEFPLAPDKWGGGCCMWQSIGTCPAGHHKDPSYLMNLSGRGILRRKDDVWFLETFEGTKQILPVDQLEGHNARVAVVTVVDLEKMKDALSGFNLDQIETLGVKAQQLQNMLGQLQEMTAKKG